jgi:hypothetical protein
MALAQRTKNLVQIRSGRTTVQVARPFTHKVRNLWGGDRPHFVIARYPTQPIEVDYVVLEDRGMLEELKARAARNRSGSAVQGPAKAIGRTVRVDYSGVPALIRHAANLEGHKTMDGPLTVKVTLLSKPEPVEPTCAHCQRTWREHIHEQLTSQGNWDHSQEDTRGWAPWNENLTRTEDRYWCPAQEAQS